MEAECRRFGPRRTRSVPPSAAGIVPAPPPSPSPPPTSSPTTCDTTGVACGNNAGILDDSWDWLDEVPLSTPVVEELEQLANSLFAEASKTQEPKPSQKSMVGEKAESLEPCWSSYLNSDCNLSLATIMEDKVTYFTSKTNEDSKSLPKLPKLDINLAQNFNRKALEKPDIEVKPVVSSIDSDATVESDEVLQTSVDLVNSKSCVDDFDENSIHIFDSGSDMMEVDGIDCVVNEEEVETTEYIESSTHSVPTILLTETANMIDLTSDDEGIVCSNLLNPKSIMEESSSDHGYESHDSPISEPEELVKLFPELW